MEEQKPPRFKRWVECGEWKFNSSDGVPVWELEGITNGLSPDILISMLSYSDDKETYVYAGYYQEETDQEYVDRVEKIRLNEEKERESAVTIINSRVLEELREKAAKYDDLCK